MSMLCSYLVVRKLLNVTYTDNRVNVLYLVVRNQSYNDPTAQQRVQDGAFAVTARQAWRGSGFRPPQGRVNGQGGRQYGGRSNDNRGRRTNNPTKCTKKARAACL